MRAATGLPGAIAQSFFGDMGRIPSDEEELAGIRRLEEFYKVNQSLAGPSGEYGRYDNAIVEGLRQSASTSTLAGVFSVDKQYALDSASEALGRQIEEDPPTATELAAARDNITSITQAALAHLPDTVTVYRAGATPNPKYNEVLSFTLNPRYNVASNLPWAGRTAPAGLVEYTVPRSSILAAPDAVLRPNMGEHEILINTKDVTRVAPAEGPAGTVTVYHASNEAIQDELRASEVGVHFAANDALARNASIKSQGREPNEVAEFNLQFKADEVADIAGQPNRFIPEVVADDLFAQGLLTEPQIRALENDIEVIEDQQYSYKLTDEEAREKLMEAFAAALSDKGIKILRYHNTFDAGLNVLGTGADVTPDLSYIVIDRSVIKSGGRTRAE